MAMIARPASMARLRRLVMKSEGSALFMENFSAIGKRTGLALRQRFVYQVAGSI
jgi:hypothetical protein